MSVEKKPREFWIHKAHSMPWTIHDKSISSGHPLEKEYHLIEFSAYKELEEKLSICKGALEFYAENSRRGTLYDSGVLARQTLAEIKRDE